MSNSNRVVLALATAAGILGTAAASRYLEAADVVGAEASKRMVQVVIGLGLALWGNYMPKGMSTQGSPACASRTARSAVRVGGWAMTLAGLAQAALWAFAPHPWARSLAMTAVAAAVAVTLSYGLWALARCRPGARRSLSA